MLPDGRTASGNGELVAAAAAFGATMLGLKPRPAANRAPFAIGSVVERYREVFANRRAVPLCAIVAIEGVLAMGAQPFVAAILQERNPVGALEAGLVIGGIGIGGLLYTLSVGFLVRRLGPRRMVVMGGAAAGALVPPVCWAGAGGAGGGGGSSGVLPNAPHMRLKAPVSASRTSTRRLPYQSATKTSFVFA